MFLPHEILGVFKYFLFYRKKSENKMALQGKLQPNLPAKKESKDG
jgi:hypothetical protein